VIPPSSTLELFGESRSARISACERYRFELRRLWGSGPLLGVCGLNPSKADGSIDDHTVRKWIGFGKRLGFGGLVGVNEFAWRATYVKDLRRALLAGFDVVGPGNDEQIIRVAREVDTFVVCWGTHGDLGGRDVELARLVAGAGVRAKCWGYTNDGQPRHPLMLPYTTALEDWRGAC
jgi:hypothetical protein